MGFFQAIKLEDLESLLKVFHGLLVGVRLSSAVWVTIPSGVLIVLNLLHINICKGSLWVLFLCGTVLN